MKGEIDILKEILAFRSAIEKIVGEQVSIRDTIALHGYIQGVMDRCLHEKAEGYFQSEDKRRIW